MSFELARIEDASLDDAALVEVIRTGGLPSAPVVAELVSDERRAAAEARVASVQNAEDAWRELGGGEAWLFHLRRRVGRRRYRELRGAARKVALCPSPGVPPATCLPYPPSVREAVALSLVTPILGRAAALLQRATRALDTVGAATSALAPMGARDDRDVVWTQATTEVVCRATRLLMVHLLGQHGGGCWWRTVGPRLGREVLPPGHYGEWPLPSVIAAGALAWRLAVRAGAVVAATPEDPGHRLYVRAAVVGRRYADLDSPFETLLQLRRLGFVLRGYSPSAISAGVCVDATR